MHRDASAQQSFQALQGRKSPRILVMDTNVAVELIVQLLKPRGMRPAVQSKFAQGQISSAQAYQASGLAVPAVLHIFEALKKGDVVLAFCARSMKELDYIVQDPYEKNAAFEGMTPKQRNAIKGFLYSRSLTFDEVAAPLTSCDKDDQCFLNTAEAAVVAGHASVDIVSLDQHLNKMRRIRAPFGIYTPQKYAQTLPRLVLPPVTGLEVQPKRRPRPSAPKFRQSA